jgi:phage tail sheath gpL-like
MGISFDSIPSSTLVPFFYSEFNNKSATGSEDQVYKSLLIGQMLSSGNALAGSIYRITNQSDCEKKFGKGSMLARMFKMYKKNDSSTDVYCIALADNAAGVKASGTLTFTGPATKSGTIVLYIGGQRITIGVTAADTASIIAAAVRDEINSLSELPVDATSLSGVVTLTCKNKGEVGNFLDVRFNYYQGEFLPDGVGVTIVAMSGGVTNPDVSPAIASMASKQYNVIACPYTDLSNLNLIQTELEMRWGPLYQSEGVLVSAVNKSFSATSTLMTNRNGFLELIVNCYNSPTPVYEIAAMVAANAAYNGAIDPARPFQTLQLVGALAPDIASQFDKSERELLLQDGCSTLTFGDDNSVYIERLVMTYTQNSSGISDSSYRDLTTILTNSYMRYTLKNYFMKKYPRHKLAKDGGQYSAGQPIMTPKLYKAELITLFRQWEADGLVEDADQFIADLVVEIDSSNPNRINSLIKPNLVNQLMVHANQIAFIL